MAGPPLIKVDASELPASSNSESPPWNAHDASSGRRCVPPPALQNPSDKLRPPRLKGGTSQVDDYGDNKYLEQRSRSNSLQSVSPSTDNAVAQAGAGFLDASDASGHGAWDKRSAGAESISLRSAEDSSTSLSDLIRERSKDAASAEARTFYPISDLEEVVTWARVRQELSNLPDLDGILDKIFIPRVVSDHKTRLFKIFVILTLMGKSEAIKDFIDGDIYDLDLPFERTTSEGTSKTKDQYLRNPQIPGRENRSEIIIFKELEWTLADIENFMEKQHAVCVPIFDFDPQPGAPVSHYNLHGKTILPYIENEESGTCGEGRSDVWRVRIHPAHIICKTLGTNTSLAVKQLNHRVGKPFTEEAEKFIKEARNLRRFASRDHDFIIKLLCTFQWRNHYYFLFPWADGNLYNFWTHHPEPLAPLKQPLTARWFSTQCLGLATALRDIHRGDAHSSTRLNPRQKNHGKHGDIKPENILYFRVNSEGNAIIPQACRTHLKISDLGEAEFHSTTSMEVDAAGVLHTPSYSAPELRVRKVSMPNYDIFSLACVLLEFVTWYLRGFQGVKRFEEGRLREPEAQVYSFQGDLKVDSFFKHVTVHVYGDLELSVSVSFGAMHKRHVTEQIAQLRQDQYCSDYILDLLDFIEDHLLRIDPKNRADCDKIYKTFQELDKQCKDDESYCITRLKQPPARSGTNLSLIIGNGIERRGKIIKILHGTEVHIKVEEQVGANPSHTAHPGDGSLPAAPGPVSPYTGPQRNVPHELVILENTQMEHEADRQQDPATTECDKAAAKNVEEASRIPESRHLILNN